MNEVKQIFEDDCKVEPFRFSLHTNAISLKPSSFQSSHLKTVLKGVTFHLMGALQPPRLENNGSMHNKYQFPLCLTMITY